MCTVSCKHIRGEKLITINILSDYRYVCERSDQNGRTICDCVTCGWNFDEISRRKVLRNFAIVNAAAEKPTPTAHSCLCKTLNKVKYI